MIVCNKCGSAIPEPPEEDPKDKKDKQAAPARRPSLTYMPCGRVPNGFRMQLVDLCDACRSALNKEINQVKFEFIGGKEI